MPLTMKKILLIIAPVVLLSACAQHQLATADKDHARLAYAKAVKGYEKALSKIEDRDAALRAADSYQRMNMAAKSAEWYAYAEKRAPLSADEALRYGQVLQSLDRTPQAMAQFDRVLAQKPDDSMAKALRDATAERNVFFVDTTLFTVTPVPWTCTAPFPVRTAHGKCQSPCLARSTDGSMKGPQFSVPMDVACTSPEATTTSSA